MLAMVYAFVCGLEEAVVGGTNSYLDGAPGDALT